MATSAQTTRLQVARRQPAGSRAARRLRRSGGLPGVLYGGDEPPLPFEVDARVLRHALSHGGAVLDLSVDGARPRPVVVKELSRHPVSGDPVHVDLLRVRMDQAIQTTVVVELTGAEDAPGVREGGVLEQVTREVTIEALPGDIPDTLRHDASGLEAGATLTLAELSPPPGVTLVDEPDTVVATVTATRLQLEDENEIEQETEVIGEAPAEAEAEGATEAGGDAAPAGAE